MIIRANPFTSEDDVHCVPGFRVGPVEERVNAGDVPIDETSGFESRLGRVQIGAKDQQVHVLGKAHGRLIDAPHPRGNRIAPDYSVGDPRVFQRCGCAQQAVFDEFHGS